MATTLYEPRELEDRVNWRDTGCAVSPSCLRCPLAVCIHDMPAPCNAVREPALAQERQRRDARIRALRARGLSYAQIQQMLHVSGPTISEAVGHSRAASRQ